VRGRSPEQAAGDSARLPEMRTGSPSGQNITYPTSLSQNVLTFSAGTGSNLTITATVVNGAGVSGTAGATWRSSKARQ